MIKHIGRHGDRKVAIVFREVPGNEHMCLLIYPEILPSHIHDTIMKVLESPAGQAENSLANVLHRNLLPDGRPILEALHREGMLKKVSCEQIIMTPTATSSVKLDELNRLIRELETGSEAAKRMAEIDASAGIVPPEKKRAAEAEFKRQRLEQAQQRQQTNLQAPANAALDDQALASSMLSQAKLMETEAKGLVAEAARLKKEAEKMFPSVKPSTPKATDSQTKATNTKGRGRPKKAVAADAVQ